MGYPSMDARHSVRKTFKCVKCGTADRKRRTFYKKVNYGVKEKYSEALSYVIGLADDWLKQPELCSECEKEMRIP